jgi:hypothetical protein
MKIKISSSPFLILSVWGKIFKRCFSEFNISTQLLKSCFFLLVIFQFFISDAIAQNFFPLKIGNIYQVEDDWWWIGPGGIGDSGTDYYNLAVVSDTIINDETFYTLSCNFGNFSFNREHLFRYDSLNHKLLVKLPTDTTTRLAVDYNVPADSHYISYIRGEAEVYISNGLSYQIVLGDTHLVYSMEDIEIPRHTYQFTEDIGFTQFQYYFGYTSGASSSTHNVVSAIIDSVIYNPLVLSVDTLYPIQDRPVDTFPFLLTFNYTASYKELIDSFYLSVEHRRADSLIQTKQYNISWWNPHVTLSLTGLLQGDEVKLKATLTDTSIFLNTAHYPDTGWVVITVLPSILNVESGETPLIYLLAQNYPNPFNPITRILYQIPEQAFITITVYDVLGNEIETLVKEEKHDGSYIIEFDGSALTSGIYYYRMMAGFFSQTKKMILLK